MRQRLSAAVEAVRKRAGQNVFWLLLVALLAAALVVPLYLFEQSGSVVVRQPVFRGELRPAPSPPSPPPPPPAPREARKPEPPPAPALPPPPPAPLVLSDARKPKPEPPPAASQREAAPLYQVQLGAFAIEERAHRLAVHAAREGFPAVVMQLKRADGQVLHRVRLRDALPKSQAETLQASVREKIPELHPILVLAGR